MTLVTKLASATALAMLMTTPVFAQAIAVGGGSVDDAIEDIERDVAADFARSGDDSRFGNPEGRSGFSGSASLAYSGQTGENDTQELAIGARLRYETGQLVQTLSMAIEFNEADGVSNKEDVFGVYDANYYLNDQFYLFGLARVSTNGLATLATETQTDAYLGFGPGYRIINTPTMTWRAQAGLGWRYVEDGTGASVDEAGYLVASRFFYQFNDNLFLTNDTDILTSDVSTVVNNEIGVNFKMSDAFSTRVSYLTEYDDSEAIRTDNKLGVALVYGF